MHPYSENCKSTACKQKGENDHNSQTNIHSLQLQLSYLIHNKTCLKHQCMAKERKRVPKSKKIFSLKFMFQGCIEQLEICSLSKCTSLILLSCHRPADHCWSHTARLRERSQTWSVLAVGTSLQPSLSS